MFKCYTCRDPIEAPAHNKRELSQNYCCGITHARVPNVAKRQI